MPWDISGKSFCIVKSKDCLDFSKFSTETEGFTVSQHRELLIHDTPLQNLFQWKFEAPLKKQNAYLSESIFKYCNKALKPISQTP